MRISHRLSTQFKKFSFVIIGATVLLSILLTITVGYFLQKRDLEKSLQEVTKVASTLIFQNNIELLIRNINFFIESNKLTRLRIFNPKTGHRLYDFKLEQHGFLNECKLSDYESVFTVKICKNIISLEVIIILCIIFSAVIIVLLMAYRYQEIQSKSMVEVLNTELDAILNFQTREKFEFDESQKFYEIHRQNEKLKEEQVRSEAMIEISRKVGHDLRSPLFFLKSLDPFGIENSEYKIALSRMESICNELLLRTKISNSDVKTNNFKKFRLESVLQELSKVKVKEYGLVADPFSFKSDIYLYSDELAFYRLFSNLFNNSIEAAKDKFQLKIDVFVNEHDDGVQIYIRDNAGGVSEKVLSQIGTSNFTTKGTQGNGIGLSSGIDFVKSLGGTFSFSNKFSGLEVLIFLPRNILMPGDSQVVLVDDDKYVLANWKKRSLEQNLKFSGYLNVADFLKDIEQFNYTTEFFIDVDIGSDSGVMLVNQLRTMGFIKLNLCTNYDPSDIKGLTEINSIIGKKFPYEHKV